MIVHNSEILIDNKKHDTLYHGHTIEDELTGHIVTIDIR